MFDSVELVSNNFGSADPRISFHTFVSLSRLTIDDTGFLINGEGRQLIWVPAHLRGDRIAVHLSSCTVVIAGTNGAVTFIYFLPDLL